MAGVFISYRRGDGGWAGRIKDHLQLRFGNSLVWQDVDDIKPGQNFPQAIDKAIKTSNVILIVIGPYWQNLGLKRLQNTKDVLRQEIQHALKSKATVIPVLVGSVSMPQAKELPASIAGLVKINASTISDADWTRGIQLLIEQLQQIIRSSGKTEQLPDLHDMLGQMETKYFQLIGKNPSKALDIAQHALKLLDEQMPRYPQDIFLQIERGYFLKNEAMALRDLNDEPGYREALSKAEQVFNIMRDESTINLASAFNGIGSVKFLQGHFKEALHWIDAALELTPDYPAALQDRKEVLKYLKKEK